MPEYLVDTWYFIARVNRFDSHFSATERIHARLRGTYVTHYGVLAELLAYFSGYGEIARLSAMRNVRDTLRNFDVLPLDHDLFLRALSLYENRRAKEYSLTDCISMVIMRDRGITTVLTNDHHFAQEGFTLLNA